MGPRLINRGNIWGRHDEAVIDMTLQWGRG